MDRWGNKEVQTLLKTVARYQKRDRKLSDAFEKVSEKLDRSKDTVQAKFYSLFAGVDKEQRDELLQRYYYGNITFTALMAVLQGKPEPPRGGRQPNWTNAERAILFAEVYKALISGETKQSAFAAASKRTQRTHSACAVRYSNEMSEAGNPNDEAEFLRNWLVDAGIMLQGNESPQEIENALTRWLNATDNISVSTAVTHDGIMRNGSDVDDTEDDPDDLDAQIASLVQRLNRVENRLDQFERLIPRSSQGGDDETLRLVQEKLDSLSQLLSERLGSRHNDHHVVHSRH